MVRQGGFCWSTERRSSCSVLLIFRVVAGLWTLWSGRTQDPRGEKVHWTQKTYTCGNSLLLFSPCSSASPYLFCPCQRSPLPLAIPCRHTLPQGLCLGYSSVFNTVSSLCVSSAQSLSFFFFQIKLTFFSLIYYIHITASPLSSPPSSSSTTSHLLQNPFRKRTDLPGI